METDNWDTLISFFPKKGGLAEAFQRWGCCANQEEILADAAKCPKVMQWTVGYWLQNKWDAPLPTRKSNTPTITIAPPRRPTETPVSWDSSAAFATVKAAWLQAGKYKGSTENWLVTQKEFDKKINSSNFDEFLSKLKMAVAESIAEGEDKRHFLGVLFSFIRGDKWKNYDLPEVSSAPTSLQYDDVVYEVNRHERIAGLNDPEPGPCPCWFCFNSVCNPVIEISKHAAHVEEFMSGKTKDQACLCWFCNNGYVQFVRDRCIAW